MSVYLGTRVYGVTNPVLVLRCINAKRSGAQLRWVMVRGGIAYYAVSSVV